MSLPLQGIRVLELTEWAFGPGACQMLGDMGAEVIKIEDPEMGDFSRAVPSLDIRAPIPPINYHFDYHNRNKMSLGIDLTQKAGREVVYQLAQKSDVFVTSLRPRAVRKLEMDYPSLCRANPRVIYAQGTGWGPKGPHAEWPGYDYLALARSGIQASLGEPGQPPPHLYPFYVDHVGGLYLAYAVMTALYHRERTGEGQEVHVSLLGTCVMMGACEVQHVLTTGKEFPRISRKQVASPLVNTYQCKDERWLYLMMIQTDRYWADWCTALGLEHLIHNPKYDTHDKRVQNSEEIIALFDRTLATRTREEWMERLAQFPSLIWEPVNTFYEAAHDPQLHENDYITEVDHPVVGPMKMVGITHHFSKSPGQIRSMAPQLGEHTEQILLDILGYDWERIAQLKEQRVIL